MPLSRQQAASARSFLGLTIKDVSENTGVDPTGLSRFERSGSGISSEWRKKVKGFYENQGLEFTDQNGIREQADIRRYRGVEGFRSFMDDVYETCKNVGGDVCLFNSKPRLWTKYLGQEWYNMHAKRMADLGDQIRFRIIVSPEETEFVLGIAEHRYIEGLKWNECITYIYGNKSAIIDFSNDDINIIVNNISRTKENDKFKFDLLWENVAVCAED
ncbi:MAG: hypothetical protein GC137_06090 [Alphaproteobacteria bacterium]|nr:hypothetical protein [Alphaproteobacteria bacterium]